MRDKTELENLIGNAVAAWRNDGVNPSFSEAELKKIKEDPVVQLLFAAVLHQSSQISDEIDNVRHAILDRYLSLTTPELRFRAAPAVAMMQVGKSSSVGKENRESTFLDETMVFNIRDERMSGQGVIPFVPLLGIRAVDAEVVSVVRRGSRVWHVEIAENEPIESLSGISFLIRNRFGQDRIRLFSSGTEVSVSNLYDFGSLPFVKPFVEGGGSMSYTSRYSILQQLVDSMCGIDATYAVVMDDVKSGQLSRSNGCIQIDMELSGAGEDVVLDREDVLLNCVPVSNISIQSSVLSTDHPICKVDTDKTWFLSMISSGENSPVEVRQVQTERQTALTWTRHLRRLLKQYEENHLVIMEQPDARMDAAVRQLTTLLNTVGVSDDNTEDATYLILTDRTVPSAVASYFTTHGVAANDLDNDYSKIDISTSELDPKRCRLLTTTAGGRDHTCQSSDIRDTERYFVKTTDRVVTISDIVNFCREALRRVFNVNASSIRNIDPKAVVENTQDGYFRRVMLVEIDIMTTGLDCARISRVLERMLKYRAASTMPIRVVLNSER